MPRWLHKLASLKLTVFLLVFCVLVLAAGTIVESLMGTQKAQAIYYAPWFLGLQFLFAVNVVCSIIERWPWGRQRLGFLLTHGALLLILMGALGTAIFKQEGQLALWEGEQSNEFVNAYTPGEIDHYSLPFTVKLDAFEIDTYPGTQRPAQFRSRVQVIDPSLDEPFSAIIEMNHPLSYRGFDFFQSSYRQESGREMTILSVSRDRSQFVVFAGYGLLIIGMTVVFFTRLSQIRQLEDSGLDPARAEPARAGSPFKIVGLLLVAGISLGAVTSATEWANGLPDTETVEQLRDLPVQHDGRVMPFDTLAREATWRVTGDRVWSGIDPVALTLGWTFQPEHWSRQQIVKFDSPALIRETGLVASAGFVSFADVAGNSRAVALMSEARSKSQLEEPLTPALTAASKLEDRLLWLQRFLNGSIFQIVPAADPNGTWTTPAYEVSPAELITLEQDNRARGLSFYPTSAELNRELRYNRWRPNRIAWIVLALASVFALLAYLRQLKMLDALTAFLLMAAFGVMTWSLATRWQIAGRIPASNMYESMLFLGWGVGLFAVFAAVFIRNRLLVVNATFMSALCMVLLDLLPMDGFIHPMPPVLTGTPWLAIHVPITMISYSVFAIGVLIAHAQIGVGLVAPAKHDLTRKLNELLYIYMHIGSILLAAGILTGSIWAASSWGRYWGWDPKEVWSLIALLAYMAILHGRFDRMIGPFGTAALSIVAFGTILMTYLGVNFILSAGLHSYGFGESSVTRWLVLFGAAEAVFLLVTTTIFLRRQQSPGTAAPAN